MKGWQGDGLAGSTPAHPLGLWGWGMKMGLPLNTVGLVRHVGDPAVRIKHTGDLIDSGPEAAVVWYAASAEGRRRAPYRATKVEAEKDCAASGVVLSVSVGVLLQMSRTPWSVVDRVVDGGIERVWREAKDQRIMSRAGQALRARGRDIPWQ